MVEISMNSLVIGNTSSLDIGNWQCNGAWQTCLCLQLDFLEGRIRALSPDMEAIVTAINQGDYSDSFDKYERLRLSMLNSHRPIKFVGSHQLIVNCKDGPSDQVCKNTPIRACKHIPMMIHESTNWPTLCLLKSRYYDSSHLNYLSDAEARLAEVAPLPGPVFTVGLSVGGAVALGLAASQNDKVVRTVAYAPLLKVNKLLPLDSSRSSKCQVFPQMIRRQHSLDVRSSLLIDSPSHVSC